MLNVFSIDLEDWFCVSNMSGVIRRDQWDQCELRVEGNTHRLLALLDRHRVHATFFVLGWIAERVPGLIREIESRGHEIAIHGYEHRLLTQMTPQQFEEDVRRTISELRGCGVTQSIIGFRAPSFTIVERTRWAFEVLERNGILYDSSVFPVGFHPEYGMPNSPLKPYRVSERLQEVPLTCVEVLGVRIPISGGAYFRFMPYALTKRLIRLANSRGVNVIFYLHPWEIDPGQPRMKLPPAKSIRHYHGLAQTEAKLERLLSDFQFTTMKGVLGL